MEDAAIVDLYWQRSDQAISETDKKYGRYCRTIAYQICNDNEDAEECVNDTWFRAWNAMPTNRPSVLATFLGRITRNLAISLFRSKNRVKRGGGELPLALDELNDCIPSDLDVAHSYEIKEFQQAVGSFVASLPETDQKIFVARYWYMTPVKDIARRLSFTESKTKSILFRLRNQLRDRLKEEGLW